MEMARRGSRQGGMSVSSGQLFSSSGNIPVNDWMDGIPLVPETGAGAASASSGRSMCFLMQNLSPLLTLLHFTDSSSDEHWTDIDDDLFLDGDNVGSMHDDDPDALLR